jgi:uncharacterized protein (DUF885 family)
MKTSQFFLSIIFAIGFIFNSCESRREIEATNPELNKLFDQFAKELMELNPILATIFGDNRFNDQFPNYISQEYKERTEFFYQHYLDELRKFNRTELSTADQINYDVLKWECEESLKYWNLPWELLPINQIFSEHIWMADIASGTGFQPFNTVEDYNNWLSRVDGFIVWCDTAIANMKKGISREFVLPTALVTKVIPQLEALSAGPVADHVFYTPVKNFPEDFAEEDREGLSEAYISMVRDKVMPVYQKMADFMKNEYLTASRPTSGYCDLENGDEIYQILVRYITTTDMTADEIFELGEREVSRITKEMEKVKNEVGYDGDLISFFDFVRNNQELMPFTDPQQVINNFNAIHEHMKPNLEQLFDMVPKTPFEVRRTPEFSENSASARYLLGSLEDGRPGVFEVPIPDVSKYNVFKDEALFLHEAIPGHHYQLSLTMESDNNPEFRKYIGQTAYIEGWALYTESLGKELGLYTDPYQYFGMLSSEMHRAIRLVVDVGIHAKGWSREKAIQYSLDHEAESEASIISEIERYMAAPGQALGYKIGQLKILELRGKAESILKEDFNIKAFHNEILQTGSVPLQVLEDRIAKWIISEKNSGIG